MTDSGWALGSRYLLHESLGRGAAGEVWSATARDTDEPLAAKVLHRQFADDQAVRLRFEHEASRQARLNHPGIVHVLDVVREGSVLALVMHRVNGPNLRRYLAEERTLPPGLACRLGSEIAAAAAAAHAAGIIHRDLKPENVLLQMEGNEPSVRVADFGVSRALNGPALTQTAQVPGTPAYLAPELVTGTPASGASDVYAVGVMMSEMLIGRRPTVQEQKELGARKPQLPSPYAQVPAAARDLLVQCLSADPRRRPVAEVLALQLTQAAIALPGARAAPAAPAPDIEAVLADISAGVTAGQQKRPSLAQLLAGIWQPSSSYKTWTAMAGSLLVLLAGGLVVPELLSRDTVPGSTAAGATVLKGDDAIIEVTATEASPSPSPTAAEPSVQASAAPPVGTTPAAPPPPVAAPEGPPQATAPPPAPRSDPPRGPAAPPAPQPNPPQAPAPAPAPQPDPPQAAAAPPRVKQPYTPEQVCGTGFRVINQAPLPRSVVYLLWSSSSTENCVVVLKTEDVGTSTPTTAYVQADGASRITDSGSFKYYAGPVRQRAPNCVRWGGSDGSGSYNSPSGQHCSS